ncbi:S-layer homology domain-containing protein [Paenibacillus sp. sptzw28]|uniref:S-layer homology domain-containing protein n=1 Tax=Paenibacillus sp. sptzw28 TaxID=715179 RepID=UPI001C6F286E|nr:S-layer homology domain-containing protein [Paenibacillus sp. sptzw28]QYR21518.1 S-layer homology domain-containing protein [Paenibacillus sp. sptzw28]
MKNVSNKMVKGLLILGLVGGFVLPAGERVSAETAYTYQDASTSFAIAGSSINLSGEHAVWRGNDKKLIGQVYYGNTRTGLKMAVTTHGKPTDSPAVGVNAAGEAVVVWADKRNYSDGPSNFNWDIYSYNISTKTEKKLNDNVGQNRIPSIDGNYIVWQTNPSYEIYLYDMGTGTLSHLGKGRDPVVRSGHIVYKGAADGDLYEYTIASGMVKKILDLPHTQYVERFVYNGEQVLWKQRDLDYYGKYTYIDLGGSSPHPVDLTQPAPQSKTEYSQMSIASGTAVWLEASGDSVIMRGADLKSKDTYSLGLVKPTQFVGFNGDELTLVSNGSLITREILRTEAVPSSPISTVQQPEGTVIGKDGGIVAKGQAVRLEFGQGTFDSDVRIGLKKSDEVSADKLIPGMSWAGIAWKWTSEAELKKPATLTFEMEHAFEKADLANRAGIYRYDEAAGRWIYTGGTVDSLWRTIRAQVQVPGLYGLFIYEPSFTDMNTHWAKSEVEVLASKWIVNGMGTGKFVPGQSVTRAQFAKMLVEAARLKAQPAFGNRFKDVPAGHWASQAVERAAAEGWVKGYEGSLFKPNAVITREEMMVMLVNAAGLGKEGQSDALAGYTDAGNVKAWAKESVEAAIKNGMIKGNGDRLSPGATSTRAEAAAVIYRWLAMKGEVFNAQGSK